MRILEQCTCGASIEVRGGSRRVWHEVAAFQVRHAKCEPAPSDEGGGTTTQVESAARHRGPSIGFTIPDAEPAWEDHA